MSEVQRHPAEEREKIRSLILKSARLLDSERFDDYVALYADNARYAMCARSPEIGRDMTWFDADRGGLLELFAELPRHVLDSAERSHLVSVEDVRVNGTGASAESNFVVFRTDPRGETQLFAVGRYEDALQRDGDEWRIKQRTVRLTTRLFATPTPTPL